MSSTFTTTSTSTFTRTSAKYIASKVSADLYRMFRYYGQPLERDIPLFEEELTILLAGAYMDSVEYGFRVGNVRVVSLVYRVLVDGSLSDDNAGGVCARADISGASWFSYLTPSRRWNELTPSEQGRIQATLPFVRSEGPTPQDGAGRWVSNRSYSADGTGTQRLSFIPSGL